MALTHQLTEWNLKQDNLQQELMRVRSELRRKKMTVDLVTQRGGRNQILIRHTVEDIMRLEAKEKSLQHQQDFHYHYKPQ